MTSVVRPATALGDGDGPPPPEEAQADVEMQPEACGKLAQMKSELERLLQLQREWSETQQRKLQQKRELEQLLGSHALQVPVSTTTEITDHGGGEKRRADATALVAESDEQKQISARKEELRQLQEQAAAVAKVGVHLCGVACQTASYAIANGGMSEQKQQQTASALAKKLEQLSADSAPQASASAATPSGITASPFLPAKRKLDDGEAAESGARFTKKLANLPVAAKLHEFSRASESLTGSPDWERSALFRIATRYLLQSGERISTLLLAEKYESYTGKSVAVEPTQDFLLPLPLSSSSTSPPHSKSRWLPGDQSLAIATFCASENDRLLAFIDLEKQGIESVCTSVLQDSHGDVSHAQRIQGAVCQATLFANLTGFSTSSSDAITSTPSSVYRVLSDAIGYNSNALESAQLKRVRYHRFRQFSGLLIEMEAWLVANKATSNGEEGNVVTGGINTTQKHSQLAKPSSSPATFMKPFDLEQDSVFRQLRSFSTASVEQKPRKRKKLDPMNMLCLYELSGVCNDENCPYQHQKDFEDGASSDCDDQTGVSKVDEESITEAQQHFQFLSKEQIALLQDFAHLRSKVARKWPVITGQGAASQATPANKPASENTQKPPSDANELAPESADATNDDGDDGSSFLELEDGSEAMNLDLTNASISGSGGSRYCEADESAELSVAALEEKIARNPADTDSWLLLAINQLDFEVKLSDDATRISDSARLLGQLVSVYRCLHLSAFSTSSPVLDESKLKMSLHILSRALEIEANAYCEALWLLYLHLSSLLPKRDFDSEFEMTEQAMHLIPSSHRLWVHYMAVGKMDSIQLSEALHSRVLSHVSKPGSFQGSQDGNRNPNLSGLLTALVVHLCIKLCGAGSSLRAMELLAALVQIPKASKTTMNDNKPGSGSDLDWCDVVQHQLSWSDLTTLSMVYAHLLLFNEIPAHVQKWLCISGGKQQVQISAFGFTAETLASEQWSLGNLPREDLKAAVAAYEIAFQTVCKSEQAYRMETSQFADVILSNWMILLAALDTQQDEQSEAAALDAFLSKNRNSVLLVPSASFTAAKLVLAGGGGDVSKNQILLACQLLTEMMHESSTPKFPEALHYYLYALRGFATPAVPEVDFPDVLGLLMRLSKSLGVDDEELTKSISEIKADTNPFGKVKVLKKLLYGLLTAWMDQLAAASHQAEKQQQPRSDRMGSSTSPLIVDVYVALDICQLMSMLLEPSVAIDGLELVLGSSKFKFLRAESRQLAWTMRFVLQLDASMQDKSTSASASVRAGLLLLFRRYMESMNMVSESVMQATSRISKAVTHQGIQSAMFECLYPQHSPWLLLEDNMRMFELCAAALPAFELPSYYSSYHYWLSPSPRFCLGYADVATHHWEWRKIRQGLRKCLLDSSTHDTALRALVALELKNQNVKGVARILEEELAADPLSMEAWRLVLGMEILFGERGSAGSSSLRTTELAAEIAKRKLTVRANLYNDVELITNSKCSLREAMQRLSVSRETADFHSWSIYRIPNAILMMDNLRSLDLSGNFLVEIPEAISRLTKLEVLNVSQNALLSVPASLARLSELRVLNVSHNNLSALPGTLWLHLSKLQELSLSANLITHLPAPPLSRLTDLRILQIGNNLLSSENVAQIRQLLSPKCAVGGLGSTSVDEASASSKSVAEGESSVEATPRDGTQGLAINESTGRPGSGEVDAMVVEDGLGKPDTSTPDDGEDIVVLEEREIGDESQKNTQQQSFMSQDEQSLSGAAETAEVEAQIIPESDQASKSDEASDAIEMEDSEGNGELVAQPDEAQQRQQQPSPWTTAAETTNGELTQGEMEICNAADLTDKLEAYINENHVRRAQVKQRNPALWRKYVESQLHLHAGLGCCVMCDLPNEGWNQRFNTMVLCPSCLRFAVEMLQARAQTAGLEESKEDH